MKLDSDWGVIQTLEIEADTQQSLLAGCMVALVQHKSVTHYRVVPSGEGGNILRLFWTSDDGAHPLPFPLTTPDDLCAFVRQWLEKRAEYPNEEPDTDGSVNHGFNIALGSFYEVMRVTPAYIVYGK